MVWEDISQSQGSVFIHGSVGASAGGGGGGTVSTVQSGSVGILGGSVNVKDAGPSFTPSDKFLKIQLVTDIAGTIWTPAAGKRINLTEFYIQTGGQTGVGNSNNYVYLIRLNGVGTLLEFMLNLNTQRSSMNLSSPIRGSPDGELVYNRLDLQSTTPHTIFTALGYES